MSIGITLIVLSLMFGGGEYIYQPICSPDDRRVEGWDYAEIEQMNADECKAEAAE